MLTLTIIGAFAGLALCKWINIRAAERKAREVK